MFRIPHFLSALTSSCCKIGLPINPITGEAKELSQTLTCFLAVLRIYTIFDQIRIRIRLLKTSEQDPDLNKFSANFFLEIFFY
jgi:hypothetical protein